MNLNELLLVGLVEEAAEVQKEACKGLRFGINDRDPFIGKEVPCNREKLETEIVQLFAMVALAKKAGLIFCDEPDLNLVSHKAFPRKIERWNEMLRYSVGRGTLEL